MLVDYVRVYRRAETVVNGDFEGKMGPFGTSNQASWSSTGGRTDPAAARFAPTSSAGASVQQVVRGLLPDTGYTVTAWGNAGTTAPSLAIGANNFGGSQVSQTLTSASYARADVAFTTGSNNRTASVFARSNNSGSLAYADDFLLRRHAAVNNGQVEAGSADAWTTVYGGASVTTDAEYDGAYAWRFPANTGSGVEQTVLGLEPGTAYRLTGWTTNGNTGLTFGVKNHGGTQVTDTVSSNTWERATVNFTTGSASDSATVFAFRSNGAQIAYADSFFLCEPHAVPWTAADVLSSGLTGASGRLGDRFTIQASGDNISSSADNFHFVHQPVSGDVTITARILGVDTTGYFAKTGLMIRESNATGARHAAVTWGPVNQLVDFSRRSSTNGNTVKTETPRDFIDPPWLRLTRRGNVFTAWHSPDGEAWTRLGTPQTINMAANALVGIPACSDDPSRFTEAVLDNVSIVPGALPDVTITSPADGVTLPDNGQSLVLAATIASTGTPAIAWSKVSGPGTVSFANPALAATSATFSATGTYVLRCSATLAGGTGSADLTVHVASPAAADPTLALRFRLDESTGTTAADSSGNNLQGTAAGGLTWRPSGGMLAGAAEFNGTDSLITVPDSPLLDSTSAFTLSFWLKADTLIENTGLVAKRVNFDNNNAFGIFLTVDGKLNVDIDTNNDRFSSTAAINPGAWNHVALVFDGSLASTERAKLYLNGTLNTTAAETSSTIPNYNSPLTIGALNSGGVVLDGRIDEVRFHRRALGESEITAIRDETGVPAPLVSAGAAPTASILIPADLTGSVTVESGPAPTSLWTQVSGPGTATFANAASPA
ncbi:MAG: carbohydrate binding domain-containing protein, partial [Verrucomicrobiae bacterium]|nr:carbohydrate binding domain-containing protein [Verrucomicrobiae bacterium]